MNITVIIGSVRENRLADSVLKKVKELIPAGAFALTFVDPLEFDLPMLNKRYYEMTQPEEKFKKLHDIFLATDGFLFVTAEYNHGIPPALKNLLDHFGSEFKYKASGICSYSNGAIGGARAVEQLRLVCATLGMPAIPRSPSWGLADIADKPEGQSFADAFERGFKTFFHQLEWYTEAFINQRKVKPV